MFAMLSRTPPVSRAWSARAVSAPASSEEDVALEACAPPAEGVSRHNARVEVVPSSVNCSSGTRPRAKAYVFR